MAELSFADMFADMKEATESMSRDAKESVKNIESVNASIDDSLMGIRTNNGKKIALIIGNSAYPFQPLSNPLNDVEGIYQTLKQIGFKMQEIRYLLSSMKT